MRSVGVEPHIPFATDTQNKDHTKLQVKELMDSGIQEFEFCDVAYKEGCSVPIIEESQKLSIAVQLARAGRNVTIRDKENLVLAVQQQYGSLFRYKVEDPSSYCEQTVVQPHAAALSARSQGRMDSYGVQRL